MTRVFVVRNGEGEAGLAGDYSHRFVDKPLTRRGRDQSTRAARTIAYLRPVAVFSSPLLRAVETATIIASATRSGLVILESLRQLNVGTLELFPAGEESRAMHERILARWRGGDHESRFPGGESLEELEQRMHYAFMEVLRDPGGRPRIVVMHEDSFRAVLPFLVGRRQAEPYLGSSMPRCAITEMDLDVVGGAITGRVIEWARGESGAEEPAPSG